MLAAARDLEGAMAALQQDRAAKRPPRFCARDSDPEYGSGNSRQ
jgi:hypothetical protein